MLTSSYEYLQALREGNYLLFLEWPQFVAEHYSDSSKLQDADGTLNLLVFEWINNGYCEEDAKKIALLFAVSDLESRPIKGYLSYALTAIGGAVFQCMLYCNNNLHTQFVTKEKMGQQKINHLMNGPVNGANQVDLEILLNEQQTIFFAWIEGANSVEVHKAFLKISPIADLRYLIEEYIIDLEASQIPGDELKSTRLSVVKRLALYLNEKTELTLEVKEEIASYVRKIRELKSAPFENKYLINLSMPSLEDNIKDNTWEIITTIGLGFFNLLQLNKLPVLDVNPININEPKI